LAKVALGSRVILVTADADNLAVILSTYLNFDTAIELAKNAGTGHPFIVRHGHTPPIFAS
jgi:hypothetical protein